MIFLEQKTGLEPATFSLENWRSNHWVTSASSNFQTKLVGHTKIFMIYFLILQETSLLNRSCDSQSWTFYKKTCFLNSCGSQSRTEYFLLMRQTWFIDIQFHSTAMFCCWSWSRTNYFLLMRQAWFINIQFHSSTM